MKVLLKEDVKNLGKAGDLVTVKDGFARNFLLPRDIAVTVNAGNIAAIESLKKRRAAEEAERVAKLQELAGRLANLKITIEQLVSDAETQALYGAVSARDIAAAIAEEGITIDPDCIQPEEPIKTLGCFTVPVKLHAEVKAELKVWVVGKDNGEKEKAEE